MKGKPPATRLDGKLIREARLRLGMTQEEVAVAVGLAQGTISAVEKGESKTLSPENLQAVADFLKIDLGTLPPPVSLGPPRICTKPYCRKSFAYCDEEVAIIIPGFFDDLPEEATFCPHCIRSKLLTNCKCGAPVRKAEATCIACGEPYVTLPKLNTAMLPSTFRDFYNNRINENRHIAMEPKIGIFQAVRSDGTT